MRGFRVDAPDGTESFIEATRYIVDDDGDLVLFAGEQQVRRVAAASWVTVAAVGRPLAAIWPPDDLDLLLERLSWEAAVRYGYHVWSVGPPEDYSSPLLNDLQAFLSRFLLQLGLDPESTDHKQMYGELRDLIRRHFRTSA